MTKSKIFTANNIKMQVYFITQKKIKIYILLYLSHKQSLIIINFPLLPHTLPTDSLIL